MPITEIMQCGEGNAVSCKNEVFIRKSASEDTQSTFALLLSDCSQLQHALEKGARGCNFPPGLTHGNSLVRNITP